MTNPNDPRDIALTPLSDETRSALPTVEAARHLGLKPETLQAWSRSKSTPTIRPLRIGRRLLWPVDALRAALEGVAS